MKKYNIENLVCVIGGNHHNMLGIIRMMGENNIKVNAIIINGDKNSFCIKSKYLSSYSLVAYDEKKIINEINKLPKDTIIIPTGDDAAFIIDKNYKKLKSKYILPSINDEENQMEKYMNKYFQNQLLKKYNLKTAESFIYEFNKNLPENLEFPVIVKPLLSIDGKKSDIQIASNINDLLVKLKEFEKKEYKRVIIQKYIYMDYECGLNGCICNDSVVIPAILKKIRRFPLKKGNVSYGKIIKKNEMKVDLSPIIHMLKEIRYNGMFDIEIFICGEDYYINEINFRNSGNSYAYMKGNVNLALIWVMKNLNLKNDLPFEVKKSYYFRDEILELKQLFNKNISFVEFIYSWFKSRSNFIINFKDPMPFLKLLFNHIR